MRRIPATRLIAGISRGSGRGVHARLAGWGEAHVGIRLTCYYWHLGEVLERALDAVDSHLHELFRAETCAGRGDEGMYAPSMRHMGWRMATRHGFQLHTGVLGMVRYRYSNQNRLKIPTRPSSAGKNTLRAGWERTHLTLQPRVPSSSIT